MRLHFKTMTRPRLVAKALKKSMAECGYPQPLTRCQEFTAELFGYPSWHELVQCHADKPPSLDDSEAPSKVSGRRQHYATVLRNHGIDESHVWTILDKVRPSNRDQTSAVAIPEDFPQFILEAFETDESGATLRSLGRQNLTSCVVGLMCPYGKGPVKILSEPPTVYSIQGGLSEDASRIGFKGRLRLPDFHARLNAFLARIGPLAAVGAFKQRLDEIRQTGWGLEAAHKELARVRAAQFSTDYARQGMLYSDHSDREYHCELEEIFDDWGYDDFIQLHPRPRFDDKPASSLWQAAYEDYVKTTAPPFVFGTHDIKWRGLDVADLRQAMKDEQSVDLDSLIENDMSEHHEDASDDVVEVEEAFKIVEAWKPHAGKGTAKDLALDARIAAWNKKQHLTSYYPDFTTMLPAFEGKTRQDAIEWCEARLARTKTQLAGLYRWKPPAAEPEPVHESALGGQNLGGQGF